MGPCGGHGLSKVSVAPAMPSLSTPCGQLPLKWPYTSFRGGHSQGGQPAAVFYPLGYPMLYAYGQDGSHDSHYDVF
jgi:hypothetical protein